MSSETPPPPLHVVPGPAGFDRAAVRELVAHGPLCERARALARGPFGHTVLTLRALEAVTTAADLAAHTGEALHAALLEDIARTGSLAIPEPTRDQRLFLGAFSVTVFADELMAHLAEIAPTPELRDDLESHGLEALLEEDPRAAIEKVMRLAAGYLDVQGKRQAGASGSTVGEREVWVVTTLHAFVAQLAGAVQRLTHHGRLRPFGTALQQREVLIGEHRYEGFRRRPGGDAVVDLKPVQPQDVVGNREYLDAGMRLARDVIAYDLERGESPKRVNPVLFALGRPGCGKTITAHAVGNYFLDQAKQRGVPARFRVIRRTDWASSYQNASASELVRIFRDEVYGFDGVCGVYWPDIDTAFASRGSGDLRMEEKNNLGAVFGIFDGTLIPRDGKWFLMCDANFMQMDEATVSRIAQNPFDVKGPTTPEEYVRLLRDVLLRAEQRFVDADDTAWLEIGKRCVDGDLSGRAIESISGNIRAQIQDFEYPERYFDADFDDRRAIVDELSNRIDAATVGKEIESYLQFHKTAEDKAAKDRFEREVDGMVRQLNAGREAASRATGLRPSSED
ncbi:MAG: hypothetical protein AAF721_35745 [Myxococcota bacterium]